MLDDRERRAWQDIERRLAADDPTFGSSMQGAGRPRRSAALAVWGVIFYVVTVVLWLLAGGTTAITSAVVFLILLPVVLTRARRHQQVQRHGYQRR
jgi:Flp pilus assembly protein TadB